MSWKKLSFKKVSLVDWNEINSTFLRHNLLALLACWIAPSVYDHPQAYVHLRSATCTLPFPGPLLWRWRCSLREPQNFPCVAKIPSVDVNGILIPLLWIACLQQPSLAFNMLCSCFSKDLVKPFQGLFIFRMLLLAARTDLALYRHLALYRRCCGFGLLAELSGERERSHLFMRKALKSQSCVAFQGYWHYLFND